MMSNYTCGQMMGMIKDQWSMIRGLMDQGRSILMVLFRSFHTESYASSDAAMRLTEKLEHYIFQWFFHTATVLHAKQLSRQLSLS